MPTANAAVVGAISAEEGEPITAVPHEERLNPGAVLQPRLVQVEVEAVDRLDVEQHVIRQHICGRTR
jgi:hypothetical protein